MKRSLLTNGFWGIGRFPYCSKSTTNGPHVVIPRTIHFWVIQVWVFGANPKFRTQQDHIHGLEHTCGWHIRSQMRIMNELVLATIGKSTIYTWFSQFSHRFPMVFRWFSHPKKKPAAPLWQRLRLPLPDDRPAEEETSGGANGGFTWLHRVTKRRNNKMFHDFPCNIVGSP